MLPVYRAYVMNVDVQCMPLLLKTIDVKNVPGKIKNVKKR